MIKEIGTQTFSLCLRVRMRVRVRLRVRLRRVHKAWLKLPDGKIAGTIWHSGFKEINVSSLLTHVDLLLRGASVTQR